MGGFGSGRSAYSDRRTVEDCYRLNISQLLQAGGLNFHHERVRLLIRPPGVMIEVARAASGPHLVFIKETGQVVKLDISKPFFGGQRFWFLCPKCERRSGVLYALDTQAGFACRACSGDLTYTSSREGTRLLRGFIQLHAEMAQISMKEARRNVRDYTRARVNARCPKKWVRKRDRARL